MCLLFDVKEQAMVVSAGALATLDRKPRQVRKEATVVVDAGAEVSLAEAASIIRDSHLTS